MVNLENIKTERKRILDLLFLITALGFVINLLTDWLQECPDYFQWTALIISIIFIVWRISSSPLFSIKRSKIITTGLIYDQNEREILYFNLKNSMVHYISLAFQELDYREEIIGINTPKYVIGDKIFGKKLLDIIVYSILSQLYQNNWKFLETKGFGSRMQFSENGSGAHINFEDLPENLLRDNIIFRYFRDQFEKKRYRNILPVKFTLPPETKMSYNIHGNYRIITFKNKYFKYDITIQLRGSHGGTPRFFKYDHEKDRLRYATFLFHIKLDTKLLNKNPLHILNSKGDEYYEWVNDLENDLEKQINYEEEIK